MNEWISCRDRFPDHHENVIFYVKNRDECFCGFFEKIPERRTLYENARNVFYENLDMWWFEDEDITHWMPIPPSPTK